ncbi:MAG: ABC transporter ATP-binding protein [Candidatus Omnitrophota bacterium]
MKDYIRLIKYTRPHTLVLLSAFVFSILAQVFQPISIVALIPLLGKVLIGENIVLANTSMPPFFYTLLEKINTMPRITLLNNFMIFYFIIFILKLIFTYFQQYLMRETSQRIVKDIRDHIYEKLLSLSMQFYSSSKTGTLVSRITYDSTVVQDAVSEGLTDLISHGALLVFSVITLIVTARAFNIPLGWVSMSLLLPPLIIGPVIRIGKRLKQISKLAQEAMAEINNSLYETISGIRIVKAFSMEPYEHGRFKNKSFAFKKATMKSNKRILAISPISELALTACGLVIIWFGGKEIIANTMRVEVLIAFVLLLASLAKPLNRLSRVHSVNQNALAAAARIFELLDTKQDIAETENAQELPKAWERIEFKDVNFSYEEKPTLKDINLEVKSGQIVALVGPSGSGKTTLVNLIPRFYDPQKGSILIGGSNLKSVTLKSLRDQIGLVTQDTILFNDTVYSNIAYGNKTIDQDKVVAAAKTANAHDFIMKMPQEYDTMIGERGFKISGGEKQRLAIARAVLKNPPILIFDEATSQLDTQSEILVQDAIDKLMSGRTVFVVAHRLSTIKHAAKIMVLDKGMIVDSGTHEELIGHKGLYKLLYDMQFKNM